MAVNLKQGTKVTGVVGANGTIQLQVPQEAVQKPKPQGKLTAKEQEQVDRLIELEAEIAPIKAKMKEFEEIKKALLSVSMDKKRFNLEEKAILQGTNGFVEFGPQSHPRAITDMHNLIGALKAKLGGYEKLIENIDIPLKVVDQYLTEAESQKFIEKTDGSRTLKSVTKLTNGQ